MIHNNVTIDWTLRDNRQLTSGRKRSSASFLTIDEVPNP